jgi:hypothetical protein
MGLSATLRLCNSCGCETQVSPRQFIISLGGQALAITNTTPIPSSIRPHLIEVVQDNKHKMALELSAGISET